MSGSGMLIPVGRDVATVDAESPDPFGVAAKAARVGLGGAVLASATMGRAVAGTGPSLHAPGEPLPAELAVDVLVGAADAVAEVAARAVSWLYRVGSPVALPATRIGATAAAEVARPIAKRLRPRLDGLAERGARRRRAAELETAELLAASLPITMQAVLDRIDLTAVALEHMDMQRVVAATMDQVDMVAIVREQLDQVDVAELIRTTPTTVAGEALRQTQAGAGKAVSAIMGRIAPRV